MATRDELIRIFEKLSELAVSTGKIETQMDILKEEVHHIKDEDIKQNQLLAEHILGVKTNAARLSEERKARLELIEGLDVRIEELEAPAEFYKMLNSKIMKVGALIITVVGACAAILRVLDLI